MSTQTLHVNTAPPVALKALAVGSTAAGGSVLGALRAYLRCPSGRWPETRQAHARLWVAVCEAVEADNDEIDDAVESMIEGAVWR